MLVYASILSVVALAGLIYIGTKGKKREKIRQMVEMPKEVIAASERIGYFCQFGQHPVDSLEDSEVAVAAIGIAFLELGGLPRPEQQAALLASLQEIFAQSQDRAEQSLVLGQWLIAQCGGAVPAMDRLTARLRVLTSEAGFRPLLQVLKAVSEAGGNLTSGRQQDALADLAERVRAA